MYLSNFHAKNPKKQEGIQKKISESWVFVSGLFVRVLWSEKKWPLPIRPLFSLETFEKEEEKEEKEPIEAEWEEGNLTGLYFHS